MHPEAIGTVALITGTAALTLLSAFLASRVDPPANDLVLHGDLVRGAVEALAGSGWAAFQDPWFDRLGAGYPMFRAYPHLAHQGTALLAWLTGLDPRQALAISIFVAVLAQPVAVYAGGRILGLSPPVALLAAFVFATLACSGPYGHTPANYWTSSGGLFAQLWGAPLAAIVLPCVLAACRWDGGGLAPLNPWVRLALASAATSLLIRCHLPTAWVTLWLGGVGVMLWGPAGELAGRLVRLAVIYAGALLLSLAFLVPFGVDLGAVSQSTLEDPVLVRSLGAGAVLWGLVRGAWLDGGFPGVWTATFIAGSGLAAVGLARGGDARLRLLVALAWVALLMYFGRATWGEWVDDVPLVGRFHDQRYLLGLHLVAPWMLAGSLAAVLAALRKGRRGAWATAIVAVLLVAAAGPQLIRAFGDLSRYSAMMPAYRERAAALQPLLDIARDPGQRLALPVADPQVAGTTVAFWLRSRGGAIQGQTSQTYALFSEFEYYWNAWLQGRDGMRAGPIRGADLVPAGAGGLLVPARYREEDPAGYPWQGAVEPAGAEGWWVVRPAAPAWARDGVALVRSDLLVHGQTSNLDGFQIAWFAMGLHRVGQFPTIDVGTGVAPDPERYARVAALQVPDIRILEGLPMAGAVGEILQVASSDDGASWSVDVGGVGEGVWLMLARSWHPGWRARVDGAPTGLVMLSPGVIGVPLPEGDHEVEIVWPVVKGRGVWAAVNTLLYVAGGLGLLGWWVVRRKAA